MGRLIDADKLIAKIEEIYDGYMFSEDGGVVPKDFVEFLEEAPTVEAISKAEYETRLKADMVAMLTEIQLEIEELDVSDVVPEYQDGAEETKEYIANMIQEKINSLKEGT